MSKMQKWVTAVAFAFLGVSGASATDITNAVTTVNERTSTTITVPNSVNGIFIQAINVDQAPAHSASWSQNPAVPGNVFNYTPVAGYVGDDAFEYTALTNVPADPIAFVTIRQPISVQNLPDNPIAVDSALFTQENTDAGMLTTNEIVLASNVNDPDGNYTNMTFTIDSTGVTNGVIFAKSTDATNSVFCYVANVHCGANTDYLRFKATDNTSLTSNWATVTINIAEVNEPTQTKNEVMFIEKQAGVTNAALELTGFDFDAPYTNLVWSFVPNDFVAGQKTRAEAYGDFVISNNVLSFYANTAYVGNVSAAIPFYVAQTTDVIGDPIQVTTNTIAFYYANKNAPELKDLQPTASNPSIYDGETLAMSLTAVDSNTNSLAQGSYVLQNFGMAKVEWLIGTNIIQTDTGAVLNETGNISTLASSFNLTPALYTLITATTNLTVKAIGTDTLGNAKTNTWIVTIKTVNDQIITCQQSEYSAQAGTEFDVEVFVNTQNTNLVFWSENTSVFDVIKQDGTTKATFKALRSGYSWIGVYAPAYQQFKEAYFWIQVSVTIPVKTLALTIMENGKVETNDLNAVTISPNKALYEADDYIELTAVPADGYTFMKWVGADAGDLWSWGTSTAGYIPYNKTSAEYIAVFKLGSATIAPVVLNPGDQTGVVGAWMDIWINVLFEGSDEPKVTATGLPSGMSCDGTYIYGQPKAAGDYTVTVTAKDLAGRSTSVTFMIKVEAIPAWAVGTFNGSWRNGYGQPGMATYTIQANGKSSGKFKAGAKTASETATDLNYVERDLDGNIASIGIYTSGGIYLYVYPSGINADDGNYAYGWLDRNVSLDYNGYYTASLPANAGYAGTCDQYTGSGYLTFTVEAKKSGDVTNGTVKVAGKLADGTAVSLSTPMFDNNCAIFYTAPTAYRGGYVYYRVWFGTNAAEKVVVESYSGNEWVNNNPFATVFYTDGGFYRDDLDVVGGMFGKITDIKSYYSDSLTVDGVVAPSFDYLKKTTEIGDTGKKTTVTTEENTEAAVDENGMTVTPNGVAIKAGFVVDKADNPSKNSDGTYNYLNDSNKDGVVNPTGLTIKLAKKSTYVTGVFSGRFLSYYDYVSAEDLETGKQTLAHVAKAVPFEGVLVPVHSDWVVDYPEGRGFMLWTRKAQYNPDEGSNESANVLKYSTKESYDFQLVK